MLQLINRNIHGRFKGNFFGIFWMIAIPVAMLIIYTFVFGSVFKVKWMGDTSHSTGSFAMIIFCGMVILNIFSEGVSSSVSAISGNPNYVKKVVFPLEIIPCSHVLSSLALGMVWLLVLIAGIVIFRNSLGWSVLSLPLIILPLILCECGLAWLVASLGVYFRDLSHIVGLLLQMLFFLTPVFYSVEMVPAGFRPLLLANPLAEIVENMRLVLIYGRWPNWENLGILIICSWVIFHLGYIWFMKTKRGFADVL